MAANQTHNTETLCEFHYDYALVAFFLWPPDWGIENDFFLSTIPMTRKPIQNSAKKFPDFLRESKNPENLW